MGTGQDREKVTCHGREDRWADREDRDVFGLVCFGIFVDSFGMLVGLFTRLLSHLLIHLLLRYIDSFDDCLF